MTSQIEIPVLRTPRLVLEPVTMKHSQGMFELWSDHAVCEFSGTVKDYDSNVIQMPARTRQDSDRIIDFWLQAARDGWGFRWAVIQLDQKKAFVGTLGFNSLSDCAEIAYHLLSAHWGKGLMTEAAKAALDWSRARGVTEIEAFIEPENPASVALARRLGMVETDTFSAGSQRYVVSL